MVGKLLLGIQDLGDAETSYRELCQEHMFIIDPVYSPRWVYGKLEGGDSEGHYDRVAVQIDWDEPGEFADLRDEANWGAPLTRLKNIFEKYKEQVGDKAFARFIAFSRIEDLVMKARALGIPAVQTDNFDFEDFLIYPNREQPTE